MDCAVATQTRHENTKLHSCIATRITGHNNYWIQKYIKQFVIFAQILQQHRTTTTTITAWVSHTSMSQKATF